MNKLITYPKIHSLWKRQGWYLEQGKKHNPEYQAGRQSFIEGDYALPEFGNIKKWQVQEKIDGTNVRIKFGPGTSTEDWTSSIHGRTADSHIPTHLANYLHGLVSKVNLIDLFPKQTNGVYPNVTLFGEGYGPKIQSGGNYRNDVGLILFDIYIEGWWMMQEDVEKIAGLLGIPYAPIIGIMTEEEIVSYVKSKPMSLCSVKSQVMEGVIARPEQVLLLRNGYPLVFKLKCKEF